MDSGNSGSLHSSSGAEDECDSRAAGLTTTHHQPPLNHHIYHQNQINNPPQSHPLNLPSFSDHHFFPSSSQPPTTTTATSTNPLPPARNPKKRSRASRRAPTTVLTTDANNFRAMVQEFTGIPSPPFTLTSLDLLGRPSAMMRSDTSNNFDSLTALPSYLFPQTLRSSPSIPSFIHDSCNLLNTMQNPNNFTSNSHSPSPLLNPKPTENLNSSNGTGQTLILEHQTTLPDLLSTTSSRNDDTNANESSGMKGFIEPWICSSDR